MFFGYEKVEQVKRWMVVGVLVLALTIAGVVAGYCMEKYGW